MRRTPGEENGDRELAELAALADGSLSPERRSSLEAQVAESAELADRLAEQQRAVALTRAAAAEVEAPAALRARIDAKRSARRRPAARGFVVIGAVATAAVVAAVGISIFASGSSSQRFQAALAATELAPSASGQATLTKTSSGWRIKLDASGLPRLDAGRFYEAWLRNRAGVLVPVGTFNEGHNVTLWAGVPPTAFTTLTVTREQADGNQRSSGEKVLVGTVSARR
jgi:hypothetical protein